MNAAHLRIGTTFVSGFVVALLAGGNIACFGQTVIIRIVNVTNKGPVRDRHVYISGITGKTLSETDERRELLTKPFSPELRLVTDANGQAQFELPKPAPDHFYVRAVLSDSHWDCTCLARVSTEEMIQRGHMVTSPYAARNPATTSIQPKPGEILFGLRPLPLWMRILWPMLKG